MYKTRNAKPGFGIKKNGNRSKFAGSSRFNSGKPSGSNFHKSKVGVRPSRKQRGEHIEISRFINRSVQINPASSYKARHTFTDFGFCQALQSNLDKREYSTPTPIQDQSIPHIMNGRDLIGLANTGTGKTAAFLLPLIEKVLQKSYEKVLIIAPTRELAIQIDNEFRAFSAGMRLYSAVCVGGMPIQKQLFALKRNPQFVIGTPGRLGDLSNRGAINYSVYTNIVLDEVDRMLDMGFINEITIILNALPARRQSLFFSATMPEKIRLLIKQFTFQPVTCEVKSGSTSANVSQDIVRIKDKTEKFNKLQSLLNLPEMTKVLIFSETKWDVEKLAIHLSRSGYNAESIHGGKRQNQRQKALSAFRNDNCKILVATDVAARGLDIGDISHVINYTVPQTYDDYIHRIGRTGRGDKLGQALTFIESN